MSGQRIWAMVLRYFYAVRDFSRLAEFVFWPIIDIGFYGLIASWVSSYAPNTHIITAFVTALVLWQLVYRANYEVCVNVIDEFWEQNIFNLVAAPLTYAEWAIAMMLSGALKISFTFLFGSTLAWIFFGVNIFMMGWPLFLFILLCLLSGWITGFMAAGVLIYYGPRLQSLPWITTALLALFSTIYYPLSILPNWMQAISSLLPTTYIFEGIRTLIHTSHIPLFDLLIGFSLALLYLIAAIRFFIHMFAKSKQQGLPRLT